MDHKININDTPTDHQITIDDIPTQWRNQTHQN